MADGCQLDRRPNPGTCDARRRVDRHSSAIAAASWKSALGDSSSSLRSGQRYLKWRRAVDKSADVASVETFGKFDSDVDIDVFIARFSVRDDTERGSAGDQGRGQWYQFDPSEVPIGNLCKITSGVRVGSVVSYRHKAEGPHVPYLTGRDLTARTCRPVRTIRHSLRLHQGPFVAVHRTSSPSQGLRVRGAVVDTKELVAVENHLIVIEPISEGTYADRLSRCDEILSSLQTPELNALINAMSRCRHLPASLLKQLMLLN